MGPFAHRFLRASGGLREPQAGIKLFVYNEIRVERVSCKTVLGEKNGEFDHQCR